MYPPSKIYTYLDPHSQLVVMEREQFQIHLDPPTDLAYIREQKNLYGTTELSYVVNLPRDILLSWKLKKTEKEDLQYVTEFNKLLPPGVKRTKNSGRLESHLSNLANKNCLTYKKLKGRRKKDFLTEKLRVCVFIKDLRDDDLTILNKNMQLEEENKVLREEKEKLEEENRRLRIKAEQLWNELQTCRTEASEAIIEEQSKLDRYIKNLEKKFVNSGTKYLSELKETQYKKKIKELKTRAQKALWFTESYGLNIESLYGTTVDGKPVNLNLLDSKKSYDALSEEDKDKVKSVVYTMDKFGISDEAYHELTLTFQGMTRSYIIKQCRSYMDGFCHIEKTPGTNPGAQLDFESELSRVLKETGDTSKTNIVKLAADGAKMTRNSTFLVLSLALLSDDTKNVMASSGNDTLAIVSANENYENIAVSFGKIFSDINELIDEDGTATIGDYKVEFFVGGDMKFLLTVLGLSMANSNYACIYCKIHKKDRHDMSKDENYYWSSKMARTLNEMCHFSSKKENNFCCKHKPLLNIPLSNYVVDELHLLLRVCDVLIRNLLNESVRLDTVVYIRTKKRSSEHLDEIVKMINSCGVTFNAWENKKR